MDGEGEGGMAKVDSSMTIGTAGAREDRANGPAQGSLFRNGWGAAVSWSMVGEMGAGRVEEREGPIY